MGWVTMDYKTIRKRKIYEEVAEALIELIQSKQLKPGDKLDSVQQLAENFQVGRSAIREALSALRAMGLIEMRQGEGTYVKKFDSTILNLPIHTSILMKKSDLRNLLEVRKILEVGAVEAAAERRTPENLAEIKKALSDMLNANGDEDLGNQADLNFHLAIAKAGQNELLLNLMNHISDIMVATMKDTRKLWLYSTKSSWERLNEDHQNIYNAIEASNKEKAKQLMYNHLNNVELVLEDYL